MQQVKAKFYRKTEKIIPIEDKLTLIGEDSPLDIARNQKGVDEHFEDHGRFSIIDFIKGEDVEMEYEAGKTSVNKLGLLKEI